MNRTLRVDSEIIRAQAQRIASWEEMRELMDGVPDILLAVNTTRQIVYANRAAANFFKAREASDLWGKRPGEAAGCVHSHETPHGCGTADACMVCGALNAILQGLAGGTVVEECRMMCAGENALDLRVWARPFELDGERFAFLSIRDISDEKRRNALEKIFFHDLLNTAGGLQSISEIIECSAPEELRELRDIITSLSEQLVDEIQAQKELLAAERGELHVQLRKINSRDVIAKVISLYLKNHVCDGKTIQSAGACREVEFQSDMPLLLRVLGNLAKNALEATPPGGTVTVGCREVPDDRVEFSMHNVGVIPKEAQLQIFNRSFSTKGGGRGLGTYSVKLLAERHLGGKTFFTSTPQEGTTFFVQLPKAAFPKHSV